MNRDDIIRMAKEAHLLDDGGVWFSSALDSDVLHDDLERFANLIAAAEREACMRDQEGLVKFNSLLAKHHASLVEQQKPGPWPAKEVIDKAVAAEREACARVCDEKREEWGWDDDGQLAARDCANAIRARGEE